MTALLGLAARSAWNRRQTLALVVLSIALATLLLQTVDRVRNDVRESFSQSVSGTDLVVGARTGPVQLMLYAVFHLGGATNNIHMSSLQAIAQHRAVDWVVPLSLGDSHRGYSVLGTTPDYFQRFRYGDRDALAFVEGRPFAGDLDALYDAVVGAEVAQALGHRRAGEPGRAGGGGARRAQRAAPRARRAARRGCRAAPRAPAAGRRRCARHAAGRAHRRARHRAADRRRRALDPVTIRRGIETFRARRVPVGTAGRCRRHRLAGQPRTGLAGLSAVARRRAVTKDLA